MEQSDILRHAVEALERMGAAYLVVGSVASTAYGEVRFTQDIDIVAAFAPHHLPDLMTAFPRPEFFLSIDAAREAIRTGFQFNVIHPASGNKIDFLLPQKSDWAAAQYRRSRPVRLLPERDVMTASPEDVILGKL